MEVNIYEFLEYKDTSVDDKTVLAKLAEKKRQWNNQRSNNERIKRKYDTVLQLEAELAANPNMLAEHRKLFKELIAEKRKAQEKKLREEAEIYVVDGEIEEQFLNALQNKYNTLSTDEILNILGARIKTDKKRKQKDGVRGNVIDSKIYKGIVTELNKIKKRDLYDFLDLKRNASADEIKVRNDKMFERATRGAITDENNTRKTLTGYVKTWLLDESKRVDYNRTLDNEDFQPITAKIDQIATVTKIIQPSQYKKLLEICTKNGKSLSQAEEMIEDYADSKGLTIVKGGITSNVTTCRFCGVINSGSDKNCKDCGMPLSIVCPKCGARTREDEMHCTKCGFDIGKMPLARKALSECDVKLEFQNIDGALQCYKEAEGYWPGYEGLASSLRKIKNTPPPEPKSLKISVSGKTVTLHWEALRTKLVQYNYLVVRKNGGIPNTPADGVQVAVTPDNRMSDIINDPLVNYYYAVFTKHNDRLSDKGAKCTQPVMIVENVRPADITLDIQENLIGFTFKASKASHIDIFRDGTRITSITGYTFIDRNLTTGKKYEYRFVAVYKDNSGALRPSSGLSMTLTPLPAPKPVVLRVEEKGKVATLSWSKPAAGEVVIYHSDKPFTILEGNKVAVDSLLFPQVETMNCSVNIAKNWSGIRYYLPVTVQGNIGVAGKTACITSIDTVEGVTATTEGNKAIVQWLWNNCSAVRVSYSQDGGSKKSRDLDKSVSPQPKLTITFPESAKSIAVEVMSIVKTPGGTLTSTPIIKILTVRPAKVEFVGVRNLKRMLMLPSDEYELTFTTDSKLPCDLHLIINEGFPPANLTNYSPAATIKAGKVTCNGPNTLVVNYRRQSKSVPLYFRIVAADRAMAKMVRIVSEIQKIK